MKTEAESKTRKALAKVKTSKTGYKLKVAQQMLKIPVKLQLMSKRAEHLKTTMAETAESVVKCSDTRKTFKRASARREVWQHHFLCLSAAHTSGTAQTRAQRNRAAPSGTSHPGGSDPFG